MTAADNFFWMFEQAVMYYRFTLINYIGFHDKGMLLAGGCGDTKGRPKINKAEHLSAAYQFGKKIFEERIFSCGTICELFSGCVGG